MALQVTDQYSSPYFILPARSLKVSLLVRQLIGVQVFNSFNLSEPNVSQNGNENFKIRM